PRIADIFRNNSTRSGLVPVEVDAEFGRELIDVVSAEPDLEVTVDVERRLVEVPAKGISVPFRLDEVARERLLAGLDDIGVTLGRSAEITDFESHRPDELYPSLA